MNVNGALAMALKASRKVGNKKFKSNFLGRNGEEGSKLGRSSSAGSSNIASHVLFDTGSRSAFGSSSRSGGDKVMEIANEKLSSMDKVNTITPGASSMKKPGLERSSSSSLWGKISKGKFH